ncbi:MAG: hypothetical protein QM760_21285 [Nibricoccus sp.]
MQNRIISFLGLLLIGVVTLQAAAPAMRFYAIELPQHVLRFSVPEEIARTLSPLEIESRFDPQDSSFLKNGFRQVAGAMYDFNGPFWVGAYGSLKFHFMVQKKMAGYDGDITTVEGLDRYVHSWNATIRTRATGCVFSQASLNGLATVRREWNTFGDATKRQPQYLEIFSLPLEDDIFLDVGFNVMGWEGGLGKERKWKAKAEALRELIKASVVLEPKRSTARQ